MTTKPTTCRTMCISLITPPALNISLSYHFRECRQNTSEHLAKLMLPREFIRRYVFHPNRCATSCKLKKRKKKAAQQEAMLEENFCFLAPGTQLFPALWNRTSPPVQRAQQRATCCRSCRKPSARSLFTKRNKETKEISSDLNLAQTLAHKQTHGHKDSVWTH